MYVRGYLIWITLEREVRLAISCRQTRVLLNAYTKPTSVASPFLSCYLLCTYSTTVRTRCTVKSLQYIRTRSSRELHKQQGTTNQDTNSHVAQEKRKGKKPGGVWAGGKKKRREKRRPVASFSRPHRRTSVMVLFLGRSEACQSKLKPTTPQRRDMSSIHPYHISVSSCSLHQHISSGISTLFEVESSTWLAKA